jgi:Winged helix-turn helix
VVLLGGRVIDPETKLDAIRNVGTGWYDIATGVSPAKLGSADLRVNFYTDSRAIADWILSKFGVPYTEEGLVPLLHRIGFSYKKPKQVLCEANLEKKAEFVAKFEDLLANLPPYSPNRNLIERLWKFARKKRLTTILLETLRVSRQSSWSSSTYRPIQKRVGYPPKFNLPKSQTNFYCV